MSEGQYKVPEGKPPAYPAASHNGSANAGDPRGANGGYYGSPGPYQQQQHGGPPPEGYYNNGGYHGGPYQQQPYGGPGGPGYGPGGGYPQGQQPGMMYGQQPYGPGPYGPQGGRYDNRGSGAGGGICAGIMGALACCCCLDCLF